MKDFLEVAGSLVDNHDSWLSRSSCIGFPYLKFESGDHDLNRRDKAYYDYCELIKKFGYADNWSNAHIGFFDVHPVYSNANPIRGLMGLHLSLMLFDKEIAGKAEGLYFDTPSNWLKFSRISERKIFPVASWVKVYADDLDLESEEIKEFFFKTSVNLLKGSELATIHKVEPTDFKSNILKTLGHTSPDNLKNECDLLANELEEFKNYADHHLENSPNLLQSALYLHAVIFCWEFGLSVEAFKDAVRSSNLKFDFASNDDIIIFSNLSLSRMDLIKIEIGEVDESDIDHTQIQNLASKPIKANSSSDESNSDAKIDLKNVSLEQNLKTHSEGIEHRYYEMGAALNSEDDCKIEIYKIWQFLTICCYGKDLNQDLYNKLRNLIGSYVSKAIADKKLTKYENRDTQYQMMRLIAYEVFVQSVYDLNLLEGDTTKISNDLFSKLTTPKLTAEQETAKNLLNEEAKEKLLVKIHNQHRLNLTKLLNQSIGKIAHPNYAHAHSPRLQSIDHVTLKQMIVSWYRDNYIEDYLKTSNEFEKIVALIERDAEAFVNNSMIGQSLLMESNNFVRSRFNPFLLLDIEYNY